MRNYVRLNAENEVAEFFDFDGDIYEIFPKDLVWIEITGVDKTPWYGWKYDGNNFFEPEPPYLDPRPQLILELARIDTESMALVRKIVLSSPDLGKDTEEKLDLERLESKAVEIQKRIDEANKTVSA